MSLLPTLDLCIGIGVIVLGGMAVVWVFILATIESFKK